MPALVVLLALLVIIAVAGFLAKAIFGLKFWWIIPTLLFFLGAPIFAVLLAFAMVGSSLERGLAVDYTGQLVKPLQMMLGEHGALFATIPLFIFAGYLLAESKAADRLIRLFQAAFGFLPGGLAIATVIACAAFTTFTGASGVTIVALGGLLLPALTKQNYPEKVSLGLVTGTGSIGLLFPPAVPLVVYGVVYGISHFLQKLPGEFSGERFFFAGIVPGLVLCTVVSIFAVAIAIKNKVPRTPVSPKNYVKGLASALVTTPEIWLIFVVLALPAAAQNGHSSLVGAAVLVPAAAFAAVYVFILEVLYYKEVKLDGITKALKESLVLSGAILIIIAASSVFTDYVTQAQIPEQLVSWISSHIESKWVFLIALNLLLILVGMMMDIFSAIVIVVPLIAGVAVKTFGIDPYHLGIIFLVNLEIGYLTPPVGLNLFVSAFRFNKPVSEVMRATLPFLAAMVVSLILITFIPSLVVLPPKKRTATYTEMIALIEVGERSMTLAGETTAFGPATFAYADCLPLAKTSKAYIECEELFLALSECEDESCKLRTNFDYASGMEDCSKASTVKNCKDAKAWSNLREVCTSLEDDSEQLRCFQASDEGLATVSQCLSSDAPEACLNELRGASGSSEDDDAAGIAACAELEGDAQLKCLENATEAPEASTDAPDTSAGDIAACADGPPEKLEECLEKAGAPPPQDTAPASAKEDAQGIAACAELTGAAEEACMEKALGSL